MKFYIIAVTLLICAALAMADEITTVEVVGTDVIDLSDTVNARDDALADAYHKAIKQAVANLLPPALIDEKASIIDDKITSRPGAYIMSMEVTREGFRPDSPNTYEVAIKAGFLTTNLQKDLAALGISPQKKGYPRLLVLMEEKNIDDTYWHKQTGKMNDAETKVRDALWGMGFPFVDQAAFIKGLSDSREKSIYEGDIDTLLTLGRINDAQVILFGRAYSTRLGTGSDVGGMSSLEATVSLKAVRADDGQTISVVSAKASQVHVDALIGGALAISKAVKEAADSISGAILKNWSIDQQSGLRITLVVNGLQSLNDVQNFKGEFQGRIKGVKSLERRTFSGVTAAFDLVAAFSCDDIVDQLNVQGLNTYTIRVRSKSPNYLELNLKAK
jgi:hypothetical protein